MHISELQYMFCDSLYDETDVRLLPHICENGIAVEARLEIYRNTMRVNLIRVLRQVYPVIEMLVGERFFHSMAKNYIQSYRSKSGNLEEYGAEMAAFLASFPPVAAFPYLSDVARLEWACHEAFHAENGTNINTEALMQLSPESYEALFFTFHPSCRLLNSPYPLYDMWKVNQPNYVGERVVDLGSGSCFLMVLRDEACVIKLVPLEKAEYDFLSCLQAGKTLYDAYEYLEKSGEPFDFGELLRKNVANGVFMACAFKA